MKFYVKLLSLFLLLPSLALSQEIYPELPQGLHYVDGAKGIEVHNDTGHMIFGERVIEIGVGKKFVIACSEIKYEDETFKELVIEWQFYHIEFGDAGGTLNLENWNLAKKYIPELGQIETTKISVGKCPR